MHSILHDWPDEHALKFLANLKPALIANYSKVLIHDLVIPAIGATPNHTAADMMMMNVNGSLERTEALWSSLLDKAGFKIVKIWSSAENLGLQCIVEAELGDWDVI